METIRWHRVVRGTADWTFYTAARGEAREPRTIRRWRLSQTVRRRSERRARRRRRT